MAIQQQCMTCRQMKDVFLDKKTEKVFCSDCQTELKSNHFLKVQLKALQQYRVKKNETFAVKCPKCNDERRPVQKNNDFHCVSCDSKLNLTEQYKLALKNFSKGDEIKT